MRAVALFPNPIVYALETSRRQLVVTSGQDAFELFVDAKLKVSLIDEYRYHEALVHPAMAAAPRRQHVLILGAGHGMVEREVLRWPDVERVVVVVIDPAIVRLASSIPFLRTHSRDAFESSKVEVVDREPIAWLDENDQRFDVVVVDLPDPVNHVEGKNYTRFFYERLARHLAQDSVAVVQATSPFVAPETHAGIAATLEATGLTTLRYRAGVPLYGDWGFILASWQPIDRPTSLPPGLKYLDVGHLATLWTPSSDTSALHGSPSTLDHQHVVVSFERERAAHGM
jgi:spermidine synthase